MFYACVISGTIDYLAKKVYWDYVWHTRGIWSIFSHVNILNRLLRRYGHK